MRGVAIFWLIAMITVPCGRGRGCFPGNRGKFCGWDYFHITYLYPCFKPWSLFATKFKPRWLRDATVLAPSSNLKTSYSLKGSKHWQGCCGNFQVCVCVCVCGARITVFTEINAHSEISAHQKQWFFKGGSTQNRWGLMGDFSKGGVHKTDGVWKILLLLKIKRPGRLFR